MRNIGRLAPSPTGRSTSATRRTYLIAWLSARFARRRRCVLRIEDIDSPRIRPGAAEQALDDLRWLGLDWDGEIVLRPSDSPLYEAALAELKRRELVYPCTCSRGDIASAASAPHAEHEGPVYPGTCAPPRGRRRELLAGSPFAWRFRVTESPSFHRPLRR